MTASSQIRIWWDTSVGAYRVVTPYNKAFVDAIHQLIPFSDRAWDPNSKMWTIAERFMEPLKNAAEKVFHSTATVVTKAQAEAAQVPKATAMTAIADACEAFFRLASQDEMAKAYRSAATRLHPDHGGDMEKMSRLNALWQRISKELWPNDK